MSKIIIGIDPGKSGGIAWKDVEGVVRVEKMPQTPHDCVDFFRECIILGCHDDISCVLEKVAPNSQNGCQGNFRLGQNYGELRMLLATLGISFTEVSPAKWMNAIVPNRPKGGKTPTARKNYIKEKMQNLYPDLKIILATSDALAILTYAMET